MMRREESRSEGMQVRREEKINVIERERDLRGVIESIGIGILKGKKCVLIDKFDKHVPDRLGCGRTALKIVLHLERKRENERKREKERKERKEKGKR